MPPTPAPSALVKLTLDTEYNVEFDVDTLLRIEEQTGRSVLDIAGLLFGADIGGPKGGYQLLRRVPLAVAMGFVGGCVGAHQDKVAGWVRQGLVFPAFIAAVPGFITAVEQLLGGLGQDREAASAGPTQPAASDVPPPGQPLDSAAGPVT
jgi:hypothetical protein